MWIAVLARALVLLATAGSVIMRTASSMSTGRPYPGPCRPSLTRAFTSSRVIDIVSITSFCLEMQNSPTGDLLSSALRCVRLAINLRQLRDPSEALRESVKGALGRHAGKRVRRPPWSGRGDRGARGRGPADSTLAPEGASSSLTVAASRSPTRCACYAPPRSGVARTSSACATRSTPRPRSSTSSASGVPRRITSCASSSPQSARPGPRARPRASSASTASSSPMTPPVRPA